MRKRNAQQSPKTYPFYSVEGVIWTNLFSLHVGKLKGRNSGYWSRTSPLGVKDLRTTDMLIRYNRSLWVPTPVSVSALTV